jgi:hypothetical protein
MYKSIRNWLARIPQMNSARSIHIIYCRRLATGSNARVSRLRPTRSTTRARATGRVRTSISRLNNCSRSWSSHCQSGTTRCGTATDKSRIAFSRKTSSTATSPRRRKPSLKSNGKRVRYEQQLPRFFKTLTAFGQFGQLPF